VKLHTISLFLRPRAHKLSSAFRPRSLIPMWRISIIASPGPAIVALRAVARPFIDKACYYSAIESMGEHEKVVCDAVRNGNEQRKRAEPCRVETPFLRGHHLAPPIHRAPQADVTSFRAATSLKDCPRVSSARCSRTTGVQVRAS
jgi:hypothetical protein